MVSSVHVFHHFTVILCCKFGRATWWRVAVPFLLLAKNNRKKWQNGSHNKCHFIDTHSIPYAKQCNVAVVWFLQYKVAFKGVLPSYNIIF